MHVAEECVRTVPERHVPGHLTGELHARNLKLFDETAKLNPPDLAKVPDPRKLAALQELFAKAYDANATLRGMLFGLRSLDVVRVLEDVSGSKTEPPVEVEA